MNYIECRFSDSRNENNIGVTIEDCVVKKIASCRYLGLIINKGLQEDVMHRIAVGWMQ